MKSLRNLFSLLALLCAVAILSGCATTDDNDSDIPWNTPQTWENTPAIPGLDGNM